MPAKVGEMFYTGETPWHGLGEELANPATLEEALQYGGLNWEVGFADLWTAEDPPSPAPMRKAIVRLDRPPGHEERVLGVAHRGFAPIQNREGAEVMDKIFGRGKGVYETGGYLGRGEVVWLLARLPREIRIGRDDLVRPYALMANSHDGTLAYSIRLTTVRVVCQNTLSMAMQERQADGYFKRSHQGSIEMHTAAVEEFFRATMAEIDCAEKAFAFLSTKACPAPNLDKVLQKLFPEPKKPQTADSNRGVLAAWEKRVNDARDARKSIAALRESGKGTDLDGARGTCWGALNAVIEYVDHHKETKGSKVSYALLGDGMDLKVKAFRILQDYAKAT